MYANNGAGWCLFHSEHGHKGSRQTLASQRRVGEESPIHSGRVTRTHRSASGAKALPPSAAGRYAAIVGRGQAERVNVDGSITGLPYLYGMVIAAADRRRFLGHWQGQQMRARPTYPGEWVSMSGVFRVPQGAAAILVQLSQAERKDDPQDGSAARFAGVRMVLFPSEDAARAYVAAYR